MGKDTSFVCQGVALKQLKPGPKAKAYAKAEAKATARPDEGQCQLM